MTVEPASAFVALDQIVIVLEYFDLCLGVGGFPGDGAGERMKLDGSLRVSNLIESVRDVDDADVIALVWDFIFLGGNDERVALDFCALIEVA